MTDLLTGVLGISLAVPVFYLAGSFFKKWLQLEDHVISGICFTALGLGLFSMLIHIAGLFGQLKTATVLAVSILLLLTRLRELPHFAAWAVEAVAAPVRAARSSSLFLTFLWLFVMGLSFALALMPEVTNDALCYQLNIAKELVWTRSTLPLYFDFNSYTPILMNHLYAVGLLFKSQALAKLFHWLCGYLIAVLIYRDCENQTKNTGLSLWLALIFFLTPTIINEVTSSYVDVAVSLFVYLFFYFWLRSASLTITGRTAVAAAFFSGIFMGFAISTKILMMIGVLPVFILLCLQAWNQKSWNYFFKTGFAFAGGILSVTLIWFIRNAVLTGNPFFPYLGRLFGAVDFGYVEHFQGMGPPKTLLNFILLPLNLTFKPDDYDRGYWIGPAFLFLLPFMMHTFWYQKKSRSTAVYTALFLVIWFALFHNARFLIPVLSLLIPAAAWGIQDCAARFEGFRMLRRLFLSGMILVTLFLTALFVYHYRLPLKVLTGQWSTEEYLKKAERSYSAAEWINANLPEKVKILNAEEIRGFYIDRPAVREVWYRRRTRYQETDSPLELYQRLKKDGFTHLLRARPAAGGQGDRFDLLDRMLQERPEIVRLWSGESQNIREFKQYYEVYEVR